MRINSSRQNHFAQVPVVGINRSSFVRSHTYKTTFNEGLLIPFYTDEVIPGDTFKLKATMFARLATPITPFMDNLYLTTFFFFVPNRLIWTNFQKFMGEQINPGDSTSYLVPQVSSVTPAENSIWDYMGIPTKIAQTFNNLHGRAYNLIWNEHFRDQNLQNSVTVDKGDGPDNPASYVLLRRGKRHDYFTSALPFVQKGPSVTIPLGTRAPVLGIGVQNNPDAVNKTNVRESNGTTTNTYANAWAASAGGNPFIRATSATGTPDIYADLTAATASTINALRQSATLQQFYERDARGGTRYTEIINSHFGVVSPDARLQRPEFLGGYTTRMNVNSVPQTSALTGQPTPLGNLAAYGTFTAHGNQNGFTKSFTEHGVLIGLMCVTADLTYQQGRARMWDRRTRVDFYWPTFAHIGEQAVFNQEIYTQGTGVDRDVFGYQERYAEYRYKPSMITGLFRSNAAAPLDYWHLSQKFTTLPVLGDTFISENPPVDRIVAVPSQPHFILDSEIELNCVRPMPIYSIPGIMRF